MSMTAAAAVFAGVASASSFASQASTDRPRTCDRFESDRVAAPARGLRVFVTRPARAPRGRVNEATSSPA